MLHPSTLATKPWGNPDIFVMANTLPYFIKHPTKNKTGINFYLNYMSGDAHKITKVCDKSKILVRLRIF